MIPSASSVNSIISRPVRRGPPIAAMPSADAPPGTPRTIRPALSTLREAAALGQDRR